MLDRITVRGAREHNLKDINLEIPRNSLSVITGLSGSGKSSLAFDTIYAEGQRRYVETLSPYARQFLDQMERPDIDSIEGLSPALSIEQKTSNRSPRSTVGTITEIYDYLRLLYSSIGVPHCPNCRIPISRQSSDQIVTQIIRSQLGKRVMVLAPIVRGRKGEFKKEFEQLTRQGFLRARVDGAVLEIDKKIHLNRRKNHTIEVVVDYLNIRENLERRLTNSINSAALLSHGLVLIVEPEGNEQLYSEKLACTRCGASVPAIEPRSFSFNSPYGACEKCSGLGNFREFDPSRVVTDSSKPLLDGGVAENLLSPSIKRAVASTAKKAGIQHTKPFKDLSERDQNLLLFGNNESPQTAPIFSNFSGLLDLLVDWNTKKSKEAWSDHHPDWQDALQFTSLVPCKTCKGQRLRPESIAVEIDGLSITAVTRLSTEQALCFFEKLKLNDRQQQIAGRLIDETRKRIQFLFSVGLDYLSLDRSAATLSSGEAQRVRLATQVGSQLRGVLYVLDEPSIGLHARDNDRLLDTLTRLRDMGNTVVVVEHDLETIKRADYVVDLGPAAGRLGGQVVAAGLPTEIGNYTKSLTGKYLSGRKKVPYPSKRRLPTGKFLTVLKARHHNLKEIDVAFPLGTLTVVTGVSGSGKSTLVNDILYPVLARRIYRSRCQVGHHESIEGLEHVDKVVRIDQSPIGRTPRSNPATYTGMFSAVRTLYAMLPESRARGYTPGRFSFNVKGGRCETCRGGGQRRIEMSFLPDVYVTCEACQGHRYNYETLEVRYKNLSIADLLEATVDDAMLLMEHIPQVYTKLQTLSSVGLGYIHLGQSAITLSGGEAQRIKLSRELSKRQTGRTLYLLDEPTTGLHFEDIRKLLEVVDRLVELGNTVIIVEHNLDVIKCADWIIDLGPEGGANGGEVVTCGSPEEIVKCRMSHTGMALAKVMNKSKRSH